MTEKKLFDDVSYIRSEAFERDWERFARRYCRDKGPYAKQDLALLYKVVVEKQGLENLLRERAAAPGDPTANTLAENKSVAQLKHQLEMVCFEIGESTRDEDDGFRIMANAIFSTLARQWVPQREKIKAEIMNRANIKNPDELEQQDKTKLYNENVSDFGRELGNAFYFGLLKSLTTSVAYGFTGEFLEQKNDVIRQYGIEDRTLYDLMARKQLSTILSFDPTRGARYSTYFHYGAIQKATASRWLSREINLARKRTSFDAPIGGKTEGTATNLYGLIPGHRTKGHETPVDVWEMKRIWDELLASQVIPQPWAERFKQHRMPNVLQQSDVTLRTLSKELGLQGETVRKALKLVEFYLRQAATLAAEPEPDISLTSVPKPMQEDALQIAYSLFKAEKISFRQYRVFCEKLDVSRKPDQTTTSYDSQQFPRTALSDAYHFSVVEKLVGIQLIEEKKVVPPAASLSAPRDISSAAAATRVGVLQTRKLGARAHVIAPTAPLEKEYPSPTAEQAKISAQESSLFNDYPPAIAPSELAIGHKKAHAILRRARETAGLTLEMLSAHIGQNAVIQLGDDDLVNNSIEKTLVAVEMGQFNPTPSWAAAHLRALETLGAISQPEAEAVRQDLIARPANDSLRASRRPRL